VSEAGPSFAVVTLGCKVNQVDGAAAAASLRACGLVETSPEDADVVVVNTCTVTGEADRKARKVVRRFARAGVPVVVTGCLVSVDPAAVSALGESVVAEPDRSLVATRALEALGREADPAAPSAPGAAVHAGTRAMVKVEDGCDCRCAYCIVPTARGVPRSVPLGEVVAGVERLVADGTPEVVLTGVNLGRYDDAGSDLAALVTAVAATGVRRVRLSSIEVAHLTQRLLESLACVPGVCRHLHVPLQSGSDAVLSAMGRPYDAATFERAIAAARDALPGLAVTTDVIAGLPGETLADLDATVALCERVGFAKTHVFPYSERPGTAAASMAGAVAPGERHRRAALLREVGERLRAAYLAGRIGGDADVLVERVEDGYALGTSEDYLKVRMPARESRPGDVVRVRLSGSQGTFALGEW